MLNLNSALAPNTILTLSGAGAGIFNIPNAQTYTGATYISGGFVNVGTSTSLGTGAGAVLNITGGNLESNATVNLTNPLNFSNASVSFSGQQNITLSGNGTLTGVNTLTLANFGQAALTGNLSGSGSLVLAQPPGNVALNTQLGYSNLLISGQNTFTGGTTIVGSIDNIVVGIEQHRHDQRPLWHRALDPDLGHALRHCHWGNPDQPGDVERQRGLGPLSMNGFSSSSSGLTFSGSVTLASNSTISVTPGGPGFVVSGNISGSGQLTVTGLGSLTLSNSGNTYSGGTVLNAGNVATTFGTLTIGSSSNFALGTGPLGIGPLTFTGGTLRATSPLTLQNRLSFSNGSTTGSSYVAFSGSPMTFSNVWRQHDHGHGQPDRQHQHHVQRTVGRRPIARQRGPVLRVEHAVPAGDADTYSATTTVNSGNLVLDANGSLNTSGVFVDVGGTFTEDNTTAGGGNPLPARPAPGSELRDEPQRRHVRSERRHRRFHGEFRFQRFGRAKRQFDDHHRLESNLKSGDDHDRDSLPVLRGDSQLPDRGQPDPGQCLQSDRDWLVWLQPGFRGFGERRAALRRGDGPHHLQQRLQPGDGERLRPSAGPASGQLYAGGVVDLYQHR